MKAAVLLAVLLPCAAVAASDCRVVEYPDHYEATCTGEPVQARGSPRPVVPAPAEARQPVPAVLPEETPPGRDGTIARSETAKRHAEIWLKAQRRR